MIDYIRGYDSLTRSGYSFFHYDEDKKSRTLLGGLGNMAIFSIIAYNALSRGIKMVQYDSPSFLSMETSLHEFHNTKAHFRDLPVHWFKVLSGEADDPLSSAELDEESL